MAAVLNPGGILVLTSPFTWLEEYTAKAKWVGGHAPAAGAATQQQQQQQQPVRCADALKAHMAGLGFTVLEEGRVSVWHLWCGAGVRALALADVVSCVRSPTTSSTVGGHPPLHGSHTSRPCCPALCCQTACVARRRRW
jgi:hypothetical protein